MLAFKENVTIVRFEVEIIAALVGGPIHLIRIDVNLDHTYRVHE